MSDDTFDPESSPAPSRKHKQADDTFDGREGQGSPELRDLLSRMREDSASDAELESDSEDIPAEVESVLARSDHGHLEVAEHERQATENGFKKAASPSPGSSAEYPPGTEPAKSRAEAQPADGLITGLNDPEVKFSKEPLRLQPPGEIRESLERMPVDLQFCLRSIHKTLGEVSALQTGEIILLGCKADGPIDLKANGKVFAHGQMVLVDDQLAVEITELLE